MSQHTPRKKIEWVTIKIPKESRRLIKAAPELLEALKDIANVMPDDEGGVSLSHENVRDILVLIAKAEARSV